MEKKSWNDLLPYKADEGALLVADVIQGLALAAVTHEVAPAAIFHVKRLKAFLELKYPIKPEDRMALVRLLYGFMVLPGMDCATQTLWASVLIKLLKKEKDLEGQDFTVDWRVLRDIINLWYFAPHRRRNFANAKAHTDLFFQLIAASQKYFSKDAVKEIMDEYRPNLFPHTSRLFVAQGFITRLLPTESDQVDQLIPELMEIWGWIQHAPNWDFLWFYLFSNIAQDRIGKIDWDPYLPTILTVVMRGLQLPLGSIKLPPSHNNELPQKTGLFFRALPDKFKLIGKFLVYMISPKNNTLNELEKFLQMIEPFFSPSNAGKLTAIATKLLAGLVEEFAERINEESQPDCKTPAEYRLTAEIKTKVTEICSKMVLVSMYGKDPMSVMSSHGILKTLAYIDPTLVFPELLKNVYSSLDSLTETHRTISSIGALAALVRLMVDRKKYPEGATHLVSLLHLTLPGIDVNDPTKTFATLQFIINTFMNVVVSDATEDYSSNANLTEDDIEVRGSTAQFEEFVTGFLEKIFTVMENMPEEKGKASFFNIESNLTKLFLNVFESVFNQLSGPLYDVALNKVARFVNENPTISAVKGVGHLCSVITAVNPQKALKVLVPICHGKIMDELEGRTWNASSPVNVQLRWYQSALFHSVTFAGEAVLEYKTELLEVLRSTTSLPHKSGYTGGNKLLKALLKTLTTVYPRDVRSVPKKTWEDKKFQAEHFLHWGEAFDREELGVEWHVPSEQEISFALKLQEEFLQPSLNYLDAVIEKRETGATVQTLARALSVVRYSLRGTTSLLPTEAPEYHDENALIKRVLPSGECLQPTHPLFAKAYSLKHRSLETVLKALGYFKSAREDETKCIKTIIKIIRVVITNRGADAEKVAQRMKGYTYFKIMLRDPTNKKGPKPRFLNVKRLVNQHALRLKYNAASAHLTAVEYSLIHELFRLSVFNPYSAIRKKAQASLQKAVRCAPSVKSQMVTDLTKVINDPETTASQLKGALYTLKLKCFLNLGVKRWNHQLEVMTALVKAQREEKPSIQELIRTFFVDFTVNFTSLPLGDIKFTPEFVGLAEGLLRKKVEPSEVERRRRLNATKIEEDRGHYTTLLSSLDEVLKSGAHWRFELMAAGFLQLIIRDDTPTDVATWFYDALTNDLPQARRLAVNAVVQILYSLKLRARNDTMESYKKVVTIPHPVTDDFVAAFQKNLAQPVTAANEGSVYFVDEHHLGWHGWPTSYKVYQAGKALNTDKSFNVEHLREVLNSPTFWKEFSGFLAQESVVGNTSIPFNSLNAQLFKSIFKYFEDEFLDKIWPELKRLCENSTDKGSQRAAAELVAGLIRGSKLWSFEKREKLGATLGPLLAQTFETITPDTLSDWSSSLTFCLHRVDHRRFQWLIDMILKVTLSTDREYSFAETRKLAFLQIVLDSHNWRLKEESFALLDHLARNLAHPYKNTRSQIGVILNRIFSLNWHPKKATDPRLIQFADSTFAKLEELRLATIKLTPEEILNNPPPYHRQSKTVLCWLFESMNRVQMNSIYPVLHKFIEHEFNMIETSDQDLQLMAKSIVDKLPQQSMPASTAQSILDTLKTSSNLSSWHIRIKVLPVFTSFVLHNIFILKKVDIDQAVDLLTQKLADPQIEVRESAALTFSGLVRSSLRNKIPALIELFKKDLAAPLPSKKRKVDQPVSSSPVSAQESDAILKRHSGVLGLASLVYSYPFDVPTWMPGVLELLARHINDPVPIQSTVKKVMADFKRTHQDTWHLDKDAFTQEQLDTLSELLVAPSYYA